MIFNSAVERYNKECDVLNIDGLGKPVSSLKSRLGDNAHASRVEDVVELYVYASYIVGDLPKGPLSGQPKLHPVNVRKKVFLIVVIKSVMR